MRYRNIKVHPKAKYAGTLYSSSLMTDIRPAQIVKRKEEKKKKMKNEKPTAVYIHHAVMVDQIKWRVINISQSREPPLPNPNRVSEANPQNRLLARDHQESQAPRPLISIYFASPLTHANRINSLSNALQPIQLDVSRQVNQ